MLIMHRRYRVLALATALLWGGLAQAAAPQLDYRTVRDTLSGHVADGFILGKGRVTYHGQHTGFRVWDAGGRAGGAVNHFVVNGRDDTGHRLRIRIEQPDGQPNEDGGRGIRIFTHDDSVFFTVVADGDQNVPADTYPLMLTADVILP